MSTKKLMFSPEEGMISQQEFLEKIAQSTELFPYIVSSKGIGYYNIPSAFDIESSSFYQDDEKHACMYIWQFGILNWVTYGRTWGEFTKFMFLLNRILGLSADNRLVVYIHNLPYEWQFIRLRFEWDKTFFLDERKPVYAISGGKVLGFEFRCSFKLSSKSLAKIGEDLQKYKVKKRVGDLDYSLIRHSKTPLSSTELGYCENDIRVVLAYIQEKIESDGDISKIPLTNTGYVRNHCRKACFKKYRMYRNFMSELILSPDEYNQLKRGFSGGFTHASARYSGKIEENVGSFDFTSSYPYVMLAEKFPMSRSKVIDHIDSLSQLMSLLKTKCCLFDVTFREVTPKLGYDHPISHSKCIKSEGETLDNGRIVTADSITITCTEQDFFTYSAFYNWESMQIHRFRAYDKGYLPTPFVMAILKLYQDKTTLKGVDSEAVNYMIKKNMLNSAYGMTVTDIVRDEISYHNGLYYKSKPNLSSAISAYNNNGNRFLFYPWGVWVTAYARANLFSGIRACGDDYIYSDTDSIKILHPERHMDYINRYNDLVKRKLEASAKHHGIDPSEFSPLNRKGVPKPIGVWDFEGIYKRFKTIGAKRYMVEKEDGSYEITVAGVNKSMAMRYILENYQDPMDALDDELTVPASHSGRLTVTYVDEECKGVIMDYLGNPGEYHETSYVHMEPSEYHLTLSDNYKAFIMFLNETMEWSD